MTAYASIEDLERRWRPLNGPDEGIRAQTLLADASRMLLRRVPTLDSDITAGTYFAEDAEIAVVAMVKRAMSTDQFDGIDQTTEGAGPFSRAVHFTNPNGNLWVSDGDLFTWFGIRASRVRTVWVS